jgi:hypothetical protein
MRRDQALIHRVAMRTAAAAVTDAPPADPSAPVAGPSRRSGAAAAGSIAIAVVTLTVVAALGLLSGSPVSTAGTGASPTPAPASDPSSSLSASALPSAPPSSFPPSGPSAPPLAAWQHSGVLVVDTGTGSTYVYVSGRLRPPVNGVSADLILGTPSPKRVKISHATLVAAQPGPAIGISAAPALPASGTLLTGELAICSVSGQATSSVAFPSSGGQVDATGFVGYTGLSGGDGLGANDLVASNRGADYLIWNRVRHPISDPVHVFAAYKWTGVVAVALPDDVLAALPVGATISPTALTPKPPKPLHLATPATLCVGVTAAGAARHTLINPQMTRPAGTFALPTANAMVIKPSSAAQTAYLITGSGTYYPIPGGKAGLSSLGFGSTPVVIAPSSVLGLLHAGPTLSRQAALAG